MIDKQQLEKVEKKIAVLQHRLGELGPMRPGSLSVQYRNPSEEKGAFYQISYTYRGKGCSEYVRRGNVEVIREELATYKQFTQLVDELIELSIEASRLRIQERNSQKST